MSLCPLFQESLRRALAELGEVREPGALPDDLELRISIGAITRDEATGEMLVRERRSRPRIDRRSSRVLEECTKPLAETEDHLG
jgi:hypothetical protein